MLNRFAYWLIEHLGPVLLRLYFAGIRVRENERSRRFRAGFDRDHVFAFWHSHQLSGLMIYRNRGIHILISRSKDGEYVARLAKTFGYYPERGSSSRGAVVGARALVEAARRGRPVAITPDGPRGPRQTVQGGALFVARQSGRAIVPVAIGYDRFWALNSWDRFRIPKPFAHGVALFGDPIPVPQDADEQVMKAVRDQLRDALMKLEEAADRQATSCRGGGERPAP